LRVLDDAYEHDAEEVIGTKANGWLIWGLFAANGNRQDSAPDFIGFNQRTVSNDGRIHANLGCYGCHYGGGRQGLHEIDGWIRGLFLPPGELALQAPDPEVLKDLRQKYLRELAGPMVADRRAHDQAVHAATGLDADQWAQTTLRMFQGYEQAVDADRAARDLGVTTAVFLGALRRQLAATGAVDTVQAGWLRGRRVPIRQYEEIFTLNQATLRGYVLP
jgi:hypothetical protein